MVVLVERPQVVPRRLHLLEDDLLVPGLLQPHPVGALVVGAHRLLAHHVLGGGGGGRREEGEGQDLIFSCRHSETLS